MDWSSRDSPSFTGDASSPPSAAPPPSGDDAAFDLLAAQLPSVPVAAPSHSLGDASSAGVAPPIPSDIGIGSGIGSGVGHGGLFAGLRQRRAAARMRRRRPSAAVSSESDSSGGDDDDDDGDDGFDFSLGSSSAAPPASVPASSSTSSASSSSSALSPAAAERGIAAGAAVDSNLAKPEWTCEACTWNNQGSDLCCTMCFTPKIDIKELNVQWQWQADEKWIPYDLATSVQLEETLVKGAESRCVLQYGFFQGKRTYTVVKNDNAYQQFNSSTGNARPVRRLGVDDDDIFVTIDLKDVEERLNFCSICQEKFSPDEPDRQPTKMRKCANHYFHKDCLNQWLQLKGACPVCKQPV